MSDFEFSADLIENTTSIRRLMRTFVASSLLVVVGAGGWSLKATVDSAVIAQGKFVVKSSAQAVQHLEGGVVGAILVKNGELVQAGQVLVRLDAAKVIAESAIQGHKLIELAAEKARLEAERLDQATIAPPAPPLSDPQSVLALTSAVAAQQALLTERQSTRSNQLAQLSERKRQIDSQIDGLAQRRTALEEELQQAAAELSDLRTLDSKGLVRRPVLRQSEREVSRLHGEIGDTESRIAGARSQLAETEFKVAEVTRTSRSDVLTQLQKVSAQFAETQDERAATQDRLQRLDIRAPRTGLVHELAVHTVGGIVAPGQKLMSIIPSDETLLVTAKIRPDEIEGVHVGQEATVRVSSLKLPVTPELDARVVGLSPDQVVDERTSQSYFSVRVAIAPHERSKLQGKELTAGLPAEVMIRGEPRQVFSYLTQPLMDRLSLAFREK